MGKQLHLGLVYRTGFKPKAMQFSMIYEDIEVGDKYDLVSTLKATAPTLALGQTGNLA